jgi:UDP:flavonoid glycosyltransferase YjiC (YdhE family)
MRVLFTLLPATGRTAAREGRSPARPRHALPVPVLPLTRLLDNCALLVTHGGFNSVKEALSRGVPMVIMPIASDQHLSAARCTALGVAETVAPDQRHADRVGRAVRAVLGDAAYARPARRLAAEMAAQPPLEEAVRRLEALV